MQKIKKIIWFNGALKQSGGGERLSLEAIKYFTVKGVNSYYVTYEYDKNKVFDAQYDSLKIVSLDKHQPLINKKSGLKKIIFKIFWLRKIFKKIHPDIIITQGTWSQVTHVYLASLFTSFKYAVYIYGSLFAFPSEQEKTKYALIFKKHLKKIRSTLKGYEEIVPTKIPQLSFDKKIKNELLALTKYFSIRRASQVFVLSKRNQWEVKKLYGKKSVVYKGAFPKKIFTYHPKQNFKKTLGLTDKKVVLTISRLAINKRVDLCIKAFSSLSKNMPNLTLVIGGKGPEEHHLKALVKKLCINKIVKFVGYIKEDNLWDYYSTCCDVFVHMDLSDFNIAPLEALALGKKVIWSKEVEIDKFLKSELHKWIFVADPNTVDTANAIKHALAFKPSKSDMLQIQEKLHYFTWDNLFKSMLKKLEKMI